MIRHFPPKPAPADSRVLAYNFDIEAMTVPSQTLLQTGSFTSKSTGTRVEYKTLVPVLSEPHQTLPLILHLHGALSSAASLDAAREHYAQSWATGALPPAVVVCASTPTQDGYYIDHANGPQWETLIAEELPNHLADAFGPFGSQAVFGVSMGGYGALKLALRRPHRFCAVAALCPVVFPGETAATVPVRNLPSLLGDMNAAMGADAETYRFNSVHDLIQRSTETLRDGTPALFFDCGDADEFHLHDGAAYLDQFLTARSIPHEFRSVPGATHAGESMPDRMDAALTFLGAALQRATTN